MWLALPYLLSSLLIFAVTDRVLSLVDVAADVSVITIVGATVELVVNSPVVVVHGSARRTFVGHPGWRTVLVVELATFFCDRVLSVVDVVVDVSVITIVGATVELVVNSPVVVVMAALAA